MNTFTKGIQLIGDIGFVLCPYCSDYNGKNKQLRCNHETR